MYCTWPGSTRMETNMHTYMYHIPQSGKEGWWGAWDLLVPCALPRPRRLPCAWPPPLLPVCVIAMFKPFLTSSYGLLCLRMLTHAHVHGDDLLCKCEAFVFVPNLSIDLVHFICIRKCVWLHVNVCVCVLHVCVIPYIQSDKGRVEAPCSRREATRMTTNTVRIKTASKITDYVGPPQNRDST